MAVEDGHPVLLCQTYRSNRINCIFKLKEGGTGNMKTLISQAMDGKTEELLEQVREELHIMVDQKIDDFRRCLVSGESWSKAEVQMPLTSLPAYFKGKKPVSIIYPDGTEIHVDKWRKLAEKLLHRCAEEEVMRERLCGMLGKFMGETVCCCQIEATVWTCLWNFIQECFLKQSLIQNLCSKSLPLEFFGP